MKLGGLILETHFFEDYLSFLTEVLELELTHLTETSMRLKLSSGYLMIKYSDNSLPQPKTTVIFELDSDEFDDLNSKISFFYYRRGVSSFLLNTSTSGLCELSDPDGRFWRFENSDYLNGSLIKEVQV